MKIKDGSVNIEDLDRSMVQAISMIDETITAWLGYEMTVTSGRDAHDKGKHPLGRAIDIRTWTNETSGVQIPWSDRAALAEELRTILGSDYRVIAEQDHIHIQYEGTTMDVKPVSLIDGKKTYIVAGLAIVGACLGYLNGDIGMLEAIGAILAALGVGGLRHGVEKATTAAKEAPPPPGLTGKMSS